MKYLCLAYYEPARMGAMPPDELKAMVSQCPALDAQLKASGHLLVSASLQGPQATFAMRPQGAKPSVTDGPFAEAKELVLLSAGREANMARISRAYAGDRNA